MQDGAWLDLAHGMFAWSCQVLPAVEGRNGLSPDWTLRTNSRAYSNGGHFGVTGADLFCFQRLRAEGGYTILVIEHDMHVVEGISDRVVALDHGVKIAEGSFDAVATDPRVVEAYLGLRKAQSK